MIAVIENLFMWTEIERAHEIKINVCNGAKTRLWLMFQICALEQSFVTFFLALLIQVSVNTLGFFHVSIVVYRSNCVQSTGLEKSKRKALFLANVLGGISYEQVDLSKERHLSSSATLTA